MYKIATKFVVRFTLMYSKTIITLWLYVSGAKGDRGFPGQPGLQGDTGSMGIPGPSGPPGLSGQTSDFDGEALCILI